jgi:hypothetical protein
MQSSIGKSTYCRRQENVDGKADRGNRNTAAASPMADAAAASILCFWKRRLICIKAVFWMKQSSTS